jgi:cytoskeletal protein CcmA (bactofilin family)
VLNPKAPKSVKEVERKAFNCPDCGTELVAPATAESTMCKRCSSHIDLRDYHISSAVSRNFRTKGAFVVEPKGYVFNTEALVGEAVIRGRFLGKLNAERSLTIYTGADIKGTFTAGLFVIPAQNRFYWDKPILVRSAEISGELTADLIARETITLKPTAVVFGAIEAANLIVEPGAVLVGDLRVGLPQIQFSPAAEAALPTASKGVPRLTSKPPTLPSKKTTPPEPNPPRTQVSTSDLPQSGVEPPSPRRKVARMKPSQSPPDHDSSTGSTRPKASKRSSAKRPGKQD